MDAQATTPSRPPVHRLELFADPTHAKDVIKGILHTIFFHRTFYPAIRPVTRDILDTTLPAVDDVDLESLINSQATDLVRQIDSTTSKGPQGVQGQTPQGRGQIAVQFFEKKRKKTYAFFGKADEEVCWEQWTLEVILARPRNESETEKVRNMMDKSLQKAAMQVVSIAGQEKDHIPPITTSDTNPFPYQIMINPNEQNWSRTGGIF